MSRTTQNERWEKENLRRFIPGGIPWALRVPCPDCRADSGSCCKNDWDMPICERRERLWEALGKPSVNTEVPELIAFMLEATHDE